MENEQFHLFRPVHNVFGGQTAREASDAAAVFENNYNRHVWDYWRVERFTAPDIFPNWEKNWAAVLPADSSDKYRVNQVARWLWRHFLNDNLQNFGALEKAHVYSLLATPRDFPFLMCLRQRRIEAGITANSLKNLEDDYSELCGGWNNTFSQEDIDLLQGAYSSAQASSSHVTAWVNQMAGRELKLKSTNFEERRVASQRIGAAINFDFIDTVYFCGKGQLNGSPGIFNERFMCFCHLWNRHSAGFYYGSLCRGSPASKPSTCQFNDGGRTGLSIYISTCTQF